MDFKETIVADGGVKKRMIDWCDECRDIVTGKQENYGHIVAMDIPQWTTN